MIGRSENPLGDAPSHKPSAEESAASQHGLAITQDNYFSERPKKASGR